MVAQAGKAVESMSRTRLDPAMLGAVRQSAPESHDTASKIMSTLSEHSLYLPRPRLQSPQLHIREIQCRRAYTRGVNLLITPLSSIDRACGTVRKSYIRLPRCIVCRTQYMRRHNVYAERGNRGVGISFWVTKDRTVFASPWLLACPVMRLAHHCHGHVSGEPVFQSQNKSESSSSLAFRECQHVPFGWRLWCKCSCLANPSPSAAHAARRLHRARSFEAAQQERRGMRPSLAERACLSFLLKSESLVDS